MFTSVRRPIPLPTFLGGGKGDDDLAPRRRRRIEALPAGLMARSGGSCEVELQDCDGRARATFRRTRKGGERLSALLHTCNACAKGAVGAGRNANKFGLLLKPDQDPTTVPVLYRGEMVTLTDDGEVTPLPAGGKLPKDRSSFPWRSLWHRVRLPLRPWLVAGVVLAVAVPTFAHAPLWFVATAVAVAAVVVYYGSYVVLARLGTKPAPVEGQSAYRRLKAILGWLRTVGAPVEVAARQEALVRRRQRAATYTAVAAGAWLVLGTLTHYSTATVPGKAVWTLLAPMFAIAAMPYWKHVRVRPPEVKPEEPLPPPPGVTMDEYEALVRAKWEGELAIAGTAATGTALHDWRKITGGWSATCTGPTGFNFESDGFRRAIAQTFKVGMSAVSIEFDPEDASQVFVTVQKVNPLKDGVSLRLSTIDAHRGTAASGIYRDGPDEVYEVWRSGMGSPHVAIYGGTGSGKSEFINTLLGIERWMQVDGHGLVASVLIDPQEGQSFAPFLDDLAMPVITTEPEAYFIIELLHEEMKRRNKYLATVPWVDADGRPRKGRKWWNPVVDGPIIAVTMDEAHEFMSSRRISKGVDRGSRMWRKCGGQWKLATQSTLLGDHGGNDNTRSMFDVVYVFRTRSAHGKNPFAGQLAVDPRQIPDLPGAHYVLARGSRAMLARSAWMEDYYNCVRDKANNPIGYPAPIPAATVKSWGPSYQEWCEQRRLGELWTPKGGATTQKPADLAAASKERERCHEACLAVLKRAKGEPMQFRDIVTESGFSTRSCTGRLGELVAEGFVETKGGKYWATRKALAA